MKRFESMRVSSLFAPYLVGTAAFLGASSLPTLAYAADDPPPLPPSSTDGASSPSASATIDAVHLRNGGLYRGRVTEIVPGDHVTIQIEKGDIKKVPWAEVDRVIVASTAIPAPPGPGHTPTAATPAVEAPMVGPRARVHINTSKTLILYRRAAGSTSWTQACTSPCNEAMPIGDTYKLTGNSVAATKEFQLDASPNGSVDIAVDPPSMGGMLAGGFLGGGGATAAYVGLLMALIGQSDASNGGSCSSSGSFSSSSDSFSCTSKSDGEKLRNAGLITFAIGSGLTVAGILIFIASAKTDITQTRGGGGAAASANEGILLAKKTTPADAFLRQPSWKTVGSSSTSTERSATGAPPAAFPVMFSGSF